MSCSLGHKNANTLPFINILRTKTAVAYIQNENIDKNTALLRRELIDEGLNNEQVFFVTSKDCIATVKDLLLSEVHVASNSPANCDMEEFTTKNEYDQFLKRPENKGKLLVIDFYAEWCGPCRKIKPFFRKLKHKYPDVVFAKVDVDDAEALAEEENVDVMPTFLFYKNGEKLHVFSGSNEKDLEDKIKELK